MRVTLDSTAACRGRMQVCISQKRLLLGDAVYRAVLIVVLICVRVMRDA